MATADLDQSDVRTRILQEATALFASRGYDATSIQSVAAAVGVTRPTLVYHFGSKDSLREEVLHRVLDHWKEDLPRVMAAASTGDDRFRRTLAAFVAFFREDPNRARLLVREMLDRPDAMRAIFRERMQPWTPLLTAAIRTSQEGGRARPEIDPEAWTTTIMVAALSLIAAGDTAGVFLADGANLDRQLDALTQMAETSLFLPSYLDAIKQRSS